MDDTQKRLEKSRKRDLERQKKAEERAQRPFEEATATDKERQKEAVEKSTESDQFTPEQQMEAGGELYKQQVAAKKGKTGEEGPGAAEAEGEAVGSVKGSWNRLQARLSAMRKLQQDAAESGQLSMMGTQMLNQAAEQAVKQVWSAIHEAVETAVVATWFLLSPLAVVLVFIRIIGYLCFNHFFSIRFRGIEVKPFPGPSWADISRIKTIFACIVTLIMILIIYILTNPCESIGSLFGAGAAKVFSSACKLFGLH